jgi:hypothetical protein
MKGKQKKWAVRLTLAEVCISILLLLSGVSALVQITRIYHWIFSVSFVILLAACHTDLTGVVLSSASKDKSLDLNKWDEMAKNLRERYSRTTYWIGWSSAVALIATIVYVGFPFLAVVYSTKVVLLEAMMHRMDEYMNDEKNKTKWGAAAYIHEVRTFIGKAEEEDKMKGFYKDI